MISKIVVLKIVFVFKTTQSLSFFLQVYFNLVLNPDPYFNPNLLKYKCYDVVIISDDNEDLPMSIVKRYMKHLTIISQL